MLGLDSIGKLAPHALFGTAVATAIVLFVPDNAATNLGVDVLREEHRGIFGWAFILSIALFGSWAIGTFILSKKRKMDAAAKRAERIDKEKKEKMEREEEERKKLEAHQAQLKQLTSEEKDFIAPFIFKDVTAQYGSLRSGVVKSLLNKSILMPPNGIGNVFAWAFNIQPWALKHLKEHPEILSGFENSEPRYPSPY